MAVVVKWYGDEVKGKVRRKVLNALNVWRLTCEAEMTRSLSGPSPSKPGSPPGTDTGRLLGSISSEIDDTKKDPIARAGSTLFRRADQPHSYPWYLEFGTIRMIARPWARRAFNITIRVFKAFLRK